MQILLVEDNLLNALALTRLAQRRGHKVTHADGGQKALDLLLSHPFDLILMDLMMPGMDGFETARRIRGLQGPQSLLPIVAVTALLPSQALDRCLRAGMNSFLTKPVDLESFQEMAESFVPHPPSASA